MPDELAGQGAAASRCSNIPLYRLLFVAVACCLPQCHPGQGQGCPAGTGELHGGWPPSKRLPYGSALANDRMGRQLTGDGTPCCGPPSQCRERPPWPWLRLLDQGWALVP